MQAKLGDPDFAVERSGVNKEELHQEMLERHQYARDFWRTQYQDAQNDMEFGFMPESQWDDWMTSTRKGRPMYTVNKLRQALKQITNDQRQNRPGVKVRAVENGDADRAEVREGLIRNIDSASDADRARDTAFQFAVGGGFGCWRVNTGYEDDGGFDLVIKKEEISNPYAVVFDPSARHKDRRDARFAFVDETYSRGAFKERWPDAQVVSIGNVNDFTRDWWMEDEVVVAEYWYKTTEEQEIVLLSDGRVLDVDDDYLSVQEELRKMDIKEQRRRVVDRTKVWQCIVSGAEILEGPTEWAGRFIPLIPVWGEILNIKGKDHFFGATRFAKDAQRMYNYERSTFIEVLADQPYSPFMADAASIEGYEQQWQKMRTDRPPVLLFNSTDEEGNTLAPPQRQSPPSFPAALAQAAAISSDDIKASTGIYDAGLGARSNETSGKAIMARQREGDIANFDYVDNLAFAMKYDFEVTNDLISAVYDTERQIRIIGQDGQEKVVNINQPIQDEQTGEWITLNDMSTGRFDVAVTVGPSYTTQRMEAAEALSNMMNDPSPFGMIAKAAFIEALDAPGLDWAKTAARKMMVEQGLAEPNEDDPPPQPQQPNPKDVSEAEKNAAQARNYDAQAQKNQADAMKTNMENAATMTALEMSSMGPGIPMDPMAFPQVPQNGMMGMPMQ
jgi:hypothetical protein